MSRDLGALLELEQGWDSYDGKPISEAAAKTADAIHFVPLSDGGIQVELHGGGVDLEIEIAADGKVGNIDWSPA